MMSPSHVKGETTRVVNPTPQEQVPNRTMEQIVASRVSHCQEVIAEVLKAIPQERVQQPMQRQVPAAQMTQNTVQSPLGQHMDRAMDIPIGDV